MIELIINDRRADLPVDFRMPWETFNPIFDFGSITGTKGWRFSLPHTRENDRIFRFAHLLDSVGVPDRYRIELIVDGTLVDEGWGFLERADYSGYELSFGSEFGSFLGDLTDQPLNRLALEIITPGVDQVAYDATLLKWCRPEIVNPSFAPDEMVMNEFNAGVYTGTNLVIMPGLLWVVKSILNQAGYSVSGDVFQDPAFQRLHFVSLYDALPETTFEIGRALPEMTVRELIQQLSMPPFGWALFINTVQKKVVIEKRGKFFSNLNTEDFSSYINPRFSAGRPNSRRLELSLEVDSSDGALKNLPPELADYRSPGTGPTFQLKGKFGSTKLEGIDQPGNTFNARSNRFAPRLMFWVGGTEPVSARAYGGYSLTLSGTNNLVETSWAEFEKFKLEAVPGDIKINLPGHRLARFNFHQNPEGPKSFYAFGHYFIIENIRATYPLKELVEMRVWMV